jgi:Divergent InlB B-repeat domain
VNRPRLHEAMLTRGMRLLVILSIVAGVTLSVGTPSALAHQRAADSAGCSSGKFQVTMTANIGTDTFHTETWPGGTQSIDFGDCEVTVTKPSGRIDLVGALGDSWSETHGAGIKSVSVESVGPHNEGLNPDGVPDCGLNIYGAYTTTNGDWGRPSCTSAVGDGTFAATADIWIHIHTDPLLYAYSDGYGATGTVISVPAGIDCYQDGGTGGTLCASNFPSGTKVVLSAVPGPESVFDGWSGSGCSGTGTCSVTLVGEATWTVAANFTRWVPVTVTKAGAGTGTVTSNPAGINCGSTCKSTFQWDSGLGLTAVPGANSEFAGWSAACDYVQKTFCGINNVDDDTTVVANFTPTHALTVSKTGTGSGTVTSDPAGIDCGATCSHAYASGTSVTLSAAPTSGSAFLGWSGAGCSGTSTCQVAMNADASVTANFVPTFSLAVSKTGTGSGKVTSTPAGINCGSTCSHQFASGTPVTLSATADSGSVFTGWSGDCSGLGSCSVTMDAGHSVTANFDLTPKTLIASKAGTGSGKVTSTPAGIDCGSTCSHQFASGQAVTLSATPDSGSGFTGWSGGCSGTAACHVTMNADTAVTATFDKIAYRPDGAIATGSGAFSGDNIYNLTGTNQTKAAKGKRNTTVTFRWRVQNDGNTPDTMVLTRGANSVAGFTTTYLVGTTNVTKAVNAGTFQKSVAAGRSFTVTVQVKVLSSAALQSVSKLRLTATSGNDSTKADTVRANTTAVQ